MTAASSSSAAPAADTQVERRRPTTPARRCTRRWPRAERIGGPDEADGNRWKTRAVRAPRPARQTRFRRRQARAPAPGPTASADHGGRTGVAATGREPMCTVPRKLSARRRARRSPVRKRDSAPSSSTSGSRNSATAADFHARASRFSGLLCSAPPLNHGNEPPKRAAADRGPFRHVLSASPKARSRGHKLARVSAALQARAEESLAREKNASCCGVPLVDVETRSYRMEVFRDLLVSCAAGRGRREADATSGVARAPRLKRKPARRDAPRPHARERPARHAALARHLPRQDSRLRLELGRLRPFDRRKSRPPLYVVDAALLDVFRAWARRSRVLNACHLRGEPLCLGQPRLNANRSHGEHHHQRRREKDRLGAGPQDSAAQPLAPRHPGRRDGELFRVECGPRRGRLCVPGQMPHPRRALPAPKSDVVALAHRLIQRGRTRDTRRCIDGRAARSRTTTARTRRSRPCRRSPRRRAHGTGRKMRVDGVGGPAQGASCLNGWAAWRATSGASRARSDNGGGFLTDHYPQATKACWDRGALPAQHPRRAARGD